MYRAYRSRNITRRSWARRNVTITITICVTTNVYQEYSKKREHSRPSAVARGNKEIHTGISADELELRAE